MFELCFVYLWVYSDYLMIDGLVKIVLLVKKVVVLGMLVLVIIDFINFCGLVKFYGVGYGVGIKFIVGVDFNVQCDLLGDELIYLMVLVVNNIGYQNLMLLILKVYQCGYGVVGLIIDCDWFIELNEGLIFFFGGCMGDVGCSFLCGNSVLVDECVVFYEEYFLDCYFFELICIGRLDEESYLYAVVELVEVCGLFVVVINDVCFIDSSDFDVYEICVVIYDGFIFDDFKCLCNYLLQ